MDLAHYTPTLLPYLLSAGAFADTRFCLLDVGCSGGIDSLWTLFGPHLVAHGFDPQRQECERLTAAERNPNVRYHALLIGLPPDSEFARKRRDEEASRSPYHASPWPRFSSVAAVEAHRLAPQSQSVHEDLTEETLSIDAFCDRERLDDVDFLKIDTDGFDLEAARSAERTLRDRNVLGALIESPFTGGAAGTENSFHNIDRYMKERGFVLYALSTHRYSRRHLPGRFVYRIPAQTHEGQVVWGDALYLRDAAAEGYRSFFGTDLPFEKLVKLLALYELFRLPDCAAELLVERREAFASRFDVDRALDLLATQIAGCSRTYAQHMRLFATNVEGFFPPPPAPEPQTRIDAWRRFTVRLLRAAANRLAD